MKRTKLCPTTEACLPRSSVQRVETASPTGMVGFSTRAGGDS